jgi:hypothetical protein
MVNLNLQRYYTFGLSLIKLMFVVGVMGLVITGIYEYLIK